MCDGTNNILSNLNTHGTHAFLLIYGDGMISLQRLFVCTAHSRNTCERSLTINKRRSSQLLIVPLVFSKVWPMFVKHFTTSPFKFVLHKLIFI